MKRPTGADPVSDESDAEHTLRNHLAVILGYCDLLLSETSTNDPRYGDLIEMQRAAKAALSLTDAERGA